MRLELTRSTDLAIRAIRSLNGAPARMKRSELAAVIGTTPDFLARVMTPLVRMGWIDSGPGRNGGYAAAVDLTALSVLEVVDAVEGVPSGDRCVLRGGTCDSSEPCALHDAWVPARRGLLDQLRATPVLSTDHQETTHG